MHTNEVEVLRAVRSLEAAHGATTVREVQAFCRFSSSSVAAYWLRKAVCAGLVAKRAGSVRTLRLTEAGRAVLVQEVQRCA